MPHKDPEAAKAYHLAYEAKNKERLFAYRKAYREKNREKIRAYKRDNNDRLREQKKVRRALTREHVRAREKAYYQRKARAYRTEYAKKWKEENRDKARASARLYFRNHRAKYVARDKAIKDRTIDLKSIEEFYSFVKTQVRIACAYCGEMISGRDTHIDHIVPISRGGMHSIDNLCASCPACNLSKHNKLLTEWKPMIISTNST